MDDTTRNVVFGPLPSGAPMTFGMAWDSSATFTMRARARDMGGAVSPLSPRKFVDVSEAKINWAFQTVDGDAFYSSPAVSVDSAGDTLVYVGCDNAWFYAFDARTGVVQDSFRSLANWGVEASPVVSSDGKRLHRG